MRSKKFAALVPLMLLTGGSAAAAGSVTGSAALALAGVVAPNSPYLSSAERRAVAAFFAGNDAPGNRKISVTADKIVCRISDVDITARSCELTFKKTTRSLKGRAANELYATAVFAGVPSDGAAGSIFESVAKLNCTLDPKQLRDKGGGGAECSYEAPN
jgi:hypothetical protein